LAEGAVPDQEKTRTVLAAARQLGSDQSNRDDFARRLDVGLRDKKKKLRNDQDDLSPEEIARLEQERLQNELALQDDDSSSEEEFVEQITEESNSIVKRKDIKKKKCGSSKHDARKKKKENQERSIAKSTKRKTKGARMIVTQAPVNQIRLRMTCRHRHHHPMTVIVTVESEIGIE
jgi:hypothetical protein